MAERTPSAGQTIGPFFHCALPYPHDRELVELGSPGSIRLHGHVYDGAGQAVPDALIEIRQTDATGAVPRTAGSLRRDGHGFTGWGRTTTDDTGYWWCNTIEPAPHRTAANAFFAVAVFARGLLDRLFTRIYLPEGPLGQDALLSQLDDADRARLIASREPDGGLRFDIHLQGERESVFLSHSPSPALEADQMTDQMTDLLAPRAHYTAGLLDGDA